MISIALNKIKIIDFHKFDKAFLFILNGKINQTNSYVANIFQL